MQKSTGIELLQMSELNRLIPISDACFGAGYLKLNQFTKFLSAGSLGLIYRVNGKVVGYCLSTVFERTGDYKETYSSEITEIAYPLGLIKNIAVLPDYQNRGIGKLLLDAIIHKLNFKFGCKTLHYPAWTESENYEFTKKLRGLGFTVQGVFPDYWAKDSLEKNYYCQRCGAPPCSCSLTLFVKN
ncbi:MAG: N-acetyltransferase family protein [Salinivirgaceae bacterium]|jgi:ribosomal protein S18 acetylase RimI-like enzyme